MSTKEYIELRNEAGEVYFFAQYHEDQKLMRTFWKGELTSAGVYGAVKQSMTVLNDCPYSKLLLIFHDIVGSITEAWEPILSEWLPLRLKGGLQLVALVIPADYSTIEESDEIEERLEKVGLKVMPFLTEEEAMQWFRAEEIKLANIR
jgi:hypothetical protein